MCPLPLYAELGRQLHCGRFHLVSIPNPKMPRAEVRCYVSGTKFGDLRNR
jgi:hypothetical protein